MGAAQRPNTQEMVMIHRVFRREFGMLPDLIRRVRPDDPARVALLAEALDDLFIGLHVHHSGEDTLLWPKLLTRARPDTGLIERMEAQHVRVAALVEAAEQLLAEWRSTGDPRTADRLATGLKAMTAELDLHLTEEESRVLPLVAEHITATEWAALGEHGLATLGKDKLLMTLGAILEDATPAERARFLAKVPLPGRVAWQLIGRRKYRRTMQRRRAG
jgi:hemerythrin-like domain-containing protein